MTPFRSALEHALLMERLRLATLLAVFLGSLVYLAAALHQVQIVENPTHASDLDRHSIRRVRIPATRGRILDRHGAPLADSVPDYTLGIFVEEWRQRGAWSNTVNAIDAYVDALAPVVGRPREITREAIERHILRRRPLALTAWTHLDPAALARLCESTNVLHGADIQVRADRIYPYGDAAAHVVGYVGRAQPERAPTPEEADDEPEDFDYYLSDLIGRGGVEKALDTELAGLPGGELVRIDAIGYKHAGAVGRAPVDGRDVVLSLDLAWQREAERLLEGWRGAAVVVDVATGELPVLASSPRFDLREFLPSLSPATWARLNANRDRPLVNRATQGVYPPGSTLKPFVALAALDAGVATRGRIIECGGAFHLGGDAPPLRCGHRVGHGPIDIETAIEQSCNVYFCQVGTDLGYEPALRDSLSLLGLGRRPAIEIPASPGLLPSSDWKRRVHRDSWRRGDTANLSIGQGFLLVTPLQMALATAAIANGGDVLRPRLVLAPRPAGDAGREVAAHMPWRRTSLDIVRRGMWRVVNAPEGGGRHARLDGLEIAAKTGTAEYTAPDRSRRKHTWMIAYAPYRAPKYAMAIVIEDGESGGKTAAPLVRRIFAAMYGLDPGVDEEDAPAEYHDLPPPEPEEPDEELRDGFAAEELSAEAPQGTSGGISETWIPEIPESRNPGIPLSSPEGGAP